jgi:hypothetical protein
MKAGDLVRHSHHRSQGMVKYREEQYGLGVVLKVKRPPARHRHHMHLQCLVLWRTGEQTPHPAAQLEVINESR